MCERCLDEFLAELPEDRRGMIAFIRHGGLYERGWRAAWDEWRRTLGNPALYPDLRPGARELIRQILFTRLFEILRARGLTVDAPAQARLRAVQDVDAVLACVRDAPVVDSVDELRGGSPGLELSQSKETTTSEVSSHREHPGPCALTMLARPKTRDELLAVLSRTGEYLLGHHEARLEIRRREIRLEARDRIRLLLYQERHPIFRVEGPTPEATAALQQRAREHFEGLLASVIAAGLLASREHL